MGDYKIHPAPHPPSAPPASHSRHSSVGTHSSMSSISLHMPDDQALRREQEQSLMRSDEEAGAQQKDFVYRMPQPLPPDHPGLRAARKAGKRGRGRCCCGRSCCCCCAIVLAVLVSIVIAIAVAALVLYLVLQPKAPDFNVSGATVSSFNLSAQPSSPADAIDGAAFYLNADVTFNATAENPNKKIGIFYDAVDVSLLYEGQQIGQGSIPAFYSGHRSSTVLLLRMKGQDVGLTPALGDALQTSLADADSSVLLHSRAIASVRFKVGIWKSRSWKIQVDCDVKMSNPAAPNPRLLSKSCSYKVNNFKI